MLVRISPGEVLLGRPTSFAIYNGDGSLLLQSGHVVTSETQLDRLRRGYRDGSASRRGTEGQTEAPSQQGQGSPESSQLQSHAVPTSTPPKAAKATLPSLSRKVEFFHLIPQGEKEGIRVELIGVIPDEALIIRPTSEEGAALFVPGMSYDGRLFTGSRLFKFTTQVIPEAVAPLGCVFLRYPESIAQAVVRKHERVSTLFAAKLSVDDRKDPVMVVVRDLSSIGAGVIAKEDAFQVGESVWMTMSLSPDCQKRPLTLVVAIRNRRQEGDKFFYGLEFVRMHDEARRAIRDFLLDNLTA